MIKFLKSPAIMASGVPNIITLSPDPADLCDRKKYLLQQKHAGNNSDLINKENIALVDKILEHKSISKKA